MITITIMTTTTSTETLDSVAHRIVTENLMHHLAAVVVVAVAVEVVVAVAVAAVAAETRLDFKSRKLFIHMQYVLSFSS
jgi:hypothetical protein